jgi:hypothetical protein
MKRAPASAVFWTRRCAKSSAGSRPRLTVPVLRRLTSSGYVAQRASVDASPPSSILSLPVLCASGYLHLFRQAHGEHLRPGRVPIINPGAYLRQWAALVLTSGSACFTRSPSARSRSSLRRTYTGCRLACLTRKAQPRVATLGRCSSCSSVRAIFCGTSPIGCSLRQVQASGHESRRMIECVRRRACPRSMLMFLLRRRVHAVHTRARPARGSSSRLARTLFTLL